MQKVHECDPNTHVNILWLQNKQLPLYPEWTTYLSTIRLQTLTRAVTTSSWVISVLGRHKRSRRTQYFGLSYVGLQREFNFDFSRSFDFGQSLRGSDCLNLESNIPKKLGRYANDFESGHDN